MFTSLSVNIPSSLQPYHLVGCSLSLSLSLTPPSLSVHTYFVLLPLVSCLYVRSCVWQAVPWWCPWIGSTVPCLKTTLSLLGPPGLQPDTSCTMFWVAQGQDGLCQPPACQPLPVGQLCGWHEEPMLRFGCSPVSAGHLRLDCVLLHEYDPIDPEKNLDNPKLGSSFCSTCSFSPYRAI